MENKNEQIAEVQTKKVKKVMDPKKKKITVAGIIVGIVAVIAILIGVNHTAIMSYLTYAFMPKKLEPTVDGYQMEFHVYKNKEYNQFKDKETPLKAFGFYYIDSDGKKVDLGWDGAYTGAKGTKFTPNIWFLMKAQENKTTFQNKANKVIPFVVIILVVLIIYLWFKNWCKREDKRMEQLYGKKEDRHNNSNGNKKKKKK